MLAFLYIYGLGKLSLPKIKSLLRQKLLIIPCKIEIETIAETVVDSMEAMIRYSGCVKNCMNQENAHSGH